MPATARPAILSPEALERLGLAMYGDHWKPPLARALGVSLSSLKMMMLGQRVIHAGIARDLARLASRRSSELSVIAAELEQLLGVEAGHAHLPGAPR